MGERFFPAVSRSLAPLCVLLPDRVMGGAAASQFRELLALSCLHILVKDGVPPWVWTVATLGLY